MKKTFKIILFISLILNVGVVIIQFIDHREKVDNWERGAKFKYDNMTRFVNITETKKSFLDSLFHKYPHLKTKKYLFINFWDTGDQYSIKQLPTLDTIIEPLIKDM